MTSMDLETAARQARQGDRQALETLVEAIRHDLYRLSLRMLYHPQDAEDATQEILIKVVTRLASFRGESAFRTWAWRVACNHLLTTRERRAERWALTFERCESMIDPATVAGVGSGPGGATDAEGQLLVKEMRLWCLQGMLLCLERPLRLAFILGTVFELSGAEAAALLGVTPATYRKRLSRARGEVHRFMQRHCGLLRPGNPCRCERQLPATVRAGLIQPGRLLFATHPVRERCDRAAAELAGDMDELGLLSSLFRDAPDYAAPESILQGLRAALGHRA
jgi:RNA polymerase sigma factor (sigma-70 family)